MAIHETFLVAPSGNLIVYLWRDIGVTCFFIAQYTKHNLSKLVQKDVEEHLDVFASDVFRCSLVVILHTC